MKNKKIKTIFSSIITAILVCVAVIFLVKYQLEIKPLKNSTQKTTSADAHAIAEEETSTSDVPIDDRTYEIDGKTFHIYDVLRPCNFYNNAIIYNNSRYLFDAYPDFVVDYLIREDESHEKDASRYIERIHNAYTELFGDYFVVNNTIVDATVFNDEEVEKMNIFYDKTFFDSVSINSNEAKQSESDSTSFDSTNQEDATPYSTETESIDNDDSVTFAFNIEYAILINSDCYIQYTDKALATEMKTDSETEYFICYYAEGKWYLDYLYTDYYFYN